jgi:hypothetical protein
MAVRLLTGYFGSPEPYASNGFEDMVPDQDTGDIYTMYGDTHNGSVTLENGFFGAEER